MKRNIAAALYHCGEFNTDEQRHMFCPKTEMTSCKYQADIINNTKTGIHNKIFRLVKPKFMELSDDELLKMFLHEKTQNSNESVNGVIWKKCPKDIYVGRSTLEMGVDSAIISFNFGARRLLDVFREYGLQDALYTNTFCRKKDKSRIKESCRKKSDKGKSSRKRLRAVRKRFGTRKKKGRVLCMDLVSAIHDNCFFHVLCCVSV